MGELSVRFPRRPTRGVILGLSKVQVVLLGVAVGLVVAGLFLGQGRGLALASVPATTLTLVALVPVRGRPLAEWAPTAVGFQAAAATGQDAWRARPSAPTVEGLLGLPGSAASLRVLSRGSTTAVFDPARRVLVAVVRVSAPAFVLLASGEQRRRVEGWSRVLAGVGHSGKVARVQVLERSLPDSSDALARWWESRRPVEGTWPSRVYDSLVAAAPATADRHETYVTVAVDASRARGNALAVAFDDLEGEQASLVRGLLAGGMTVEGWLDARGLAAVARTAYDPAGSVVLERRARTMGPGVAPETAGPLAVDEEGDLVRSDTGWHRTYWVSEWPRIEVPSSFLHPVLYAGGRRCLSIVMEPVATARALKEVRSEQVAHLVDEAQRRKVGQITTEAHRREAADTAERERDLVAGHGELRFAGFVTITAPSREELVEDCGRIETAATQALLELRMLHGQQAEAFLAGALPFAVGLG